RPRFACEPIHLVGTPKHEEHRVALAEAELCPDRLGALRSDVLGDGPGALECVAFFAPEDVSEAGLAFALGPSIHAIAKGAAAAGFGRNRPDFDLVVGGELVGEHLEAGPGEMRVDLLHL